MRRRRRRGAAGLTSTPSPGDAAPSGPPGPDGLPMPRRALAVVAISAAIAVTVLDSSMLNVALPGIARDLGVSPAAATWLLNAYQLTVVTTLLPLASLGESLGFRRVFLSGFALFGLASAGAALAEGFEALLAFRVLQGLGASAVMSLTAGLVRHTYPARQLGRAIGINAMVVAVSGASAPTLAALILSVAPWPALFAVNVPASLVGIAIGLRALPAVAGSGRRFDGLGAALNVATFGLVFLGLDLLLHATLPALLLAAGGVAAGWLLVRRQRAQPAPLLPLDLLRLPVIAVAVAASVCGFAAWYASYVSLPFLLQAAGYGQVATGLVMTPWPLGMAVAAPLAGRLADRVPTAVLCAIGMAAMAAGLLAVAAVPPLAGEVLALGAVMALCGAGFGCFQTPNNRTMLGSAPKARSGSAGGMQATARLLGTTLGTTVVALCFQVAGPGGPRAALVAGIGFAVAAGVLSLSRRRMA
jgi:MFS transporter, DHA2 family, multidrug resistance protein